MKIVIIEDEKPAGRLLKRKAEQFGCTVIAIISSVEEGLIWFTENTHPDLILVDIQLSDGLSFEIFEQITIQSAIIFTTAYDEYALKAFKLNSVDYLLKPIDENELKTAILKFSNRQSISTLNPQFIRQMLQNEYKKRYTIKAGNVLKIVDVTDISCFYSAYKSTFLVTSEGRSFPLDDSLDTLEKMCNPELFFRVNRQFIIAINAIKEISIYSNSRLKVVLHQFKEEEIIVSRERVTAFKQWIA